MYHRDKNGKRIVDTRENYQFVPETSFNAFIWIFIVVIGIVVLVLIYVMGKGLYDKRKLKSEFGQRFY